MSWSAAFFINSILLGAGLAMDAFSVSVANAMAERGMRKRRMCTVAGVYALFQIAMPLLGWFCVHSFVEHFRSFRRFVPWIALVLLLFIGGKMISEYIHGRDCEEDSVVPVGTVSLLLQGVATSIDALSVGFTIADYHWPMALVCALLIGAVTFLICLAGLLLGRTAGRRLAGKAGLVGGAILILIGIEIFLSGILA